MSLRLMWGGIAAYFLVFWYAVGDLGLAVACTFFLVLMGLNITRLALKALASGYQSQPDQTPDPSAPANRNHPPR
jgi:hypothetical protein